MDKGKQSAAVRVLTVIRHPTGGVRTYLKYTYNQLSSGRFHFTVLTIRAEEIRQIKADLKGLCHEVVEVKTFGFLYAWRLWELLRSRDVDVIHSQGYSCGVYVSLLNLLFGIPHIITLHGTIDESVFRGQLADLKRRIMAFLLASANIINVVSEDAKANLLEHLPSLKECISKVVVIENGIDVAWFRDNSGLQRKLTEIEGIEKDSFVIGYLGRYMPEKGFPVLIDAIEAIANSEEPLKSNVKVLALGWGSYVREYQALIKEKRLNSFFVFIEFQPDVRWVLRQIDMLVIPSLREAFGLVAVEGLVCGTPIIASECVGLREILRGTPARMVKPGNSKALADAILDSMVKPNKSVFMDFVPQARGRFDVSMTANRLEEIFESLVAGNLESPAKPVAK